MRKRVLSGRKIQKRRSFETLESRRLLASDLISTLLPESPPSFVGSQEGFRVAANDDYYITSSPFTWGSGDAGQGIVQVYDAADGAHLATIENPATGQNASDQFGYALDLSGDTLVVGAPSADIGDLYNAGLVYVFDLGAGTPSLTATLHDLTPQRQEQFGFEVSIDGDTIAAAVNENWHNYSAGYLSVQGSVQLFDQSSGTIVPTATIVNTTTNYSNSFALSIDVSGDAVIVGHPDFRNGSFYLGRAMVYGLDGTMLSSIENPNLSGSNNFGFDVAITNDQIAVVDIGNEVVHLYAWDGTTASTAMQIIDPTPQSGGRFGGWVDLSDAFLAVGRTNDDEVHVFDVDAGNATFSQTLTSPSAAPTYEFGRHFALHGQTIILGDRLDDSLATNSGAAFAFDLSANPAPLMAQLNTAQTASSDSFFGNDMAVNDSWLVVPSSDATTTGLRSGEVRVYARSGNDLTLQATIRNPNPDSWERFGTSVSLDGNRVIIGEPYDRTGNIAWASGLAHVYDIASDTLTTIENPTPTQYDYFGFDVESSGDFVFVSRLGRSGSGSGGGAIEVFDISAGAAVLTSTLQSPFPTTNSVSQFGERIETHQGRLYVTDAFAGPGYVHVYDINNGNPTLIRSIVDPSPSSNDNNASLESVSVNGDWLVWGQPGEDIGGVSNSGAAYLYDLSNDSPSPTATFASPVPQSSGQFGLRISVDGSTVALTENIQGGTANVHVFEIASGVPTLTETITQPDPLALNAGFGQSLLVDDETIFVGAPLDDTEGRNQGAVFVYGPSGIAPVANPDSATTDENLPLVIDVLANDTDEDSDADDLVLASIDSVSIDGLPGRDTLSAGVLSIDDDAIRFDPGTDFDPLPSGQSAVLTIGYTVADERGRFSSSTLVLTVNGTDDPMDASIVSVSGSFVEGSPVEVIAVASDIDGTDITYTYAVTKDGIAFASESGIEQRQLFFVPDDNGVYEITMTASQIAGESVSDSQSITITNANPIASIDSISDNLQLGMPVVVDATGSDAGGASDPLTFDYLVSKNGLPYASGSGVDLDTFSFTPDGYATYVVELTVTDDDGASASDVRTIPLLLTASDQLATLIPDHIRYQGERDGERVAIGSNWAATGKPTWNNAEGKVEIYDTATLTFLATISNPNPVRDDRFGNQILIDGNRVVISATGSDLAANDSGVVYVYDLSSGVPLLQATILNPGTGQGDLFGQALAIEGNTLVVGAPSANAEPSGVAQAGKVHLFDLAGETPTLVQTIENPQPTAFSRFGFSVSIDDETLVAGSINSSVWVFEVKNSLASLKFQIDPPADLVRSGFGVRVAVHGSKVVVGAPSNNLMINAGQPDEQRISSAGSAFIYDLSGATPVLETTIDNPSPDASDLFANSLSVDGNQLLIGVNRYDATGVDEAMAYVYDLDSTSGIPTTQITGAAFSGFESATAISDDQIIVGTPRDPSIGSGAAYIFDNSGTVPVLRDTLSRDGMSSSGFANSIAIDGDLSVVGAPLDRTIASSAGSVSVYDSSSGATELILTIENPTPDAGDQFGSAVAVQGNQVAVSAPQNDHGGMFRGTIYLFDISSGTAVLISTFNNNNNEGSFFGSMLWDGDRLVHAAPSQNSGNFNSGRVYVFDTSASTLSLMSTIDNPTPDRNDAFGSTVSLKDGTLVIGEPSADLVTVDGTLLNVGMVHVYDISGGTPVAITTIEGSSQSAGLGTKVAVDGDRIAITASGVQDAVDVYRLIGSSLAFEQTIVNPTPFPFDSFGSQIAISGDSLFVSATGETLTAADEGAVYVYDLAGSVAELENTIRNPTPSRNERFGFVIATSDGRLLVGVPSERSVGGSGNHGAAYLYGNFGLSPIATPDVITTGENTAILIDVLSNDTDGDSDVSSFELISIDDVNVTGVAGSAEIPRGIVRIADGQVYFDPQAFLSGRGHFDGLTVGETATVVVDYTMADGFGQRSSSTLTITVNGDDDPLIASIDSISQPRYPGISITVDASASDPDTVSPLTFNYSVLKDGSSFSNTGGLDLTSTTFTPDADGSYEIVLTVSDAFSGTSTTSQTIDVQTHLTAVDDFILTNEDVPVQIDVLAANGSVADLGPVAIDPQLTVVSVETESVAQTITNNGDGTFGFDPGTRFNGLSVGESATIAIPYTITDTVSDSDQGFMRITINGVNDVPEVIPSNYPVGTQRIANGLVWNVTDADSDFDVSAMTFSIAQPALGRVTDNGDGTFDFDPLNDFEDLNPGERQVVTFAVTPIDQHGGVGSTETMTVDVYQSQESATSLTTVPDPTRISVTPFGSSSIPGAANFGTSGNYAFSNDGRFVVFTSSASNVVPGDENGQTDVFRHDRLTGTTEMVSVNISGTSGGNGRVFGAMISGDGMTVAFISDANDLVAGIPADGSRNVFVRKFSATPTTSLVSVSTTGELIGGSMTLDGISDDGQVVLFTTTATNATPNDTNGERDVFVRKLSEPNSRLISMNAAGTGTGNGESLEPVLSRNGQRVAYTSYSSDLVSGADTNGRRDVFARSIDVGGNTLVSVNQTGTNSGGGNFAPESFSPSISDDGSAIAFVSRAEDLTPFGGSQNATQVYVRTDSTTTLGSLDQTGTAFGNGASLSPQISGDGSTVVFATTSNNLVFNDTNIRSDLIVWDVAANTRTLVTVNSSGTGTGDASTSSFSVSRDGDTIVFASASRTLVLPFQSFGEVNSDIFVRSVSQATTTMISGGIDGPTLSDAISPAVSADGSMAGFNGFSSGIVAGDWNLTRDVFVRDLSLPSATQLISTADPDLRSSTGLPVTIPETAVFSADGRYVAFQSDSPTLVDNDNNDQTDVFRYDRLTGQMDLVSIKSDGSGSPRGNSTSPSISDDGSIVAFQSDAQDVVPNDSGSFDGGVPTDIYVRRFGETPVTELVSIDSSGLLSTNQSTSPFISGDGSTVVFTSFANNLVPNRVTFGIENVYARRLDSAETILVSIGSQVGAIGGTEPSVSGDGDVIAFTTSSEGFFPADINRGGDILVRRLSTNELMLVSSNVQGTQTANARSQQPVVSHDGSTVVFISEASDFGPVDENGERDVYAYSLATGLNSLVTVDQNGEANGISRQAEALQLSGDGNLVVFTSSADDWVPNDTNSTDDIFVRNLSENTTTVVSRNSTTGAPGNGRSFNARISRDGSTIAFTSAASDLIDGDVPGPQDVYSYSLNTGQIRRISQIDGERGNSTSILRAIDADGSAVSFVSAATNFIDNDLNGGFDLYSHHADELVVRRFAGDGLQDLIVRQVADQVRVINAGDGTIVASSSIDRLHSISIFGLGNENETVTVDLASPSAFLALPGGVHFDGGNDSLGGNADDDSLIVVGDGGQTAASYGADPNDPELIRVITRQTGDPVTSMGTITYTSIENASFVNVGPVEFESSLSVGGGTVSLAAAANVTLPESTSLAGGSISSTGAVTLGVSSVVTGNGTIDTPNNAAQPIVLDGSVSGTSLNDSITLSGFVKGSGDLNNVSITGTHSPGASPAAVNVGNIRYDASGTLQIEIGGTIPGTQYDTINASGVVILQGKLEVIPIDGFTLTDDTQFTIISTPFGVAGGFDGVPESGLVAFGDQAMQISYRGGPLGRNVVLRKAAAAPNAMPDAVSTTENASLMIDVVANDEDFDSTSEQLSLDSIASISVVGLPDGSSLPAGVVTIQNGKINFQPGNRFDSLTSGQSATVQIQYIISDELGQTATGELTITVDGQGEPPETIIVSNFQDFGTGSLRDAIERANADPDFSIITFENFGDDTQTIRLLSPLPVITAPIAIDALINDVGNPFDQFPAPRIALDGSDAGENADGIQLRNNGSSIRGLAIHGFSGDGIEIVGGGDNVISQNYIGLTTAGFAAANGFGVRIANSANNNIDTNVIGGNLRSGVFIVGDAAIGNTLTNNRIGTDPTGNTGRPNGFDGVSLNASGNFIGTPENGNVISGNERAGVFAQTAGRGGNTIQSNLIGLSADGTTAVANLIGVRITNEANLIGGAGTGEFNVISGNLAHGLELASAAATGNLAFGNRIGTDPNGDTAIGNGVIGVRLVSSTGNFIGGSGHGEGNLISGNGGSGILAAFVDADNNQIVGNRIGTNLAGTAAIGNTDDGVRLVQGASDNVVFGNQISGNLGRGVATDSAMGSRGNQIVGNLIGTDASGTAALHNGAGGAVRLLAPDSVVENNVISAPDTGIAAIANATHFLIKDNKIGVTATGATTDLGMTRGIQVVGSVDRSSTITGNDIANNSRGIQINSGTGIQIVGNSIHGNTVAGIDLGTDASTANDVGDNDTGPNNRQNHPRLSDVSLSGDQLTLTYRVDSTAQSSNYALTIEFFVADSKGQGRTSIATDVYIQPERRTVKTITLTVTGLNAGDEMVATATDADGNTSEFGATATVVDGGPALSFTTRSAVINTDVNSDFNTTALDALLVINVLNKNNAEGEVLESSSGSRVYGDVNGDGRVTAIDALTIINFLNRSSAVSPSEDGDESAAEWTLAVDEVLTANQLF